MLTIKKKYQSELSVVIRNLRYSMYILSSVFNLMVIMRISKWLKILFGQRVTAVKDIYSITGNYEGIFAPRFTSILQVVF